MSSAADSHMRNLLDAITSRLQDGEALDPLMAQNEDADGDLDEVVEIIQSLQASLKPLTPRQEFADGLRAELHAGGPGAARRRRQMPARLSVAAILAVFAGFLLFMLRRILGSQTAHDVPEEAVAAPL